MPQPDPDPITAGRGAGAEPLPVAPPDPVSDPRSDDDRDVGWGDDVHDRARGRDARWYEEQRPPHWE